MRHALTLILSLLMLAPSAVLASNPTPPDQERIIDAAKEAVARQMKDPWSVRFRDVSVSPKLKSYVCGEVNAKNSFGAYEGFMPFMFNAENGDVIFVNPKDDYVAVHQTMFELICKAEQPAVEEAAATSD